MKYDIKYVASNTCVPSEWEIRLIIDIMESITNAIELVCYDSFAVKLHHDKHYM